MQEGAPPTSYPELVYGGERRQARNFDTNLIFEVLAEDKDEVVHLITSKRNKVLFIVRRLRQEPQQSLSRTTTQKKTRRSIPVPAGAPEPHN